MSIMLPVDEAHAFDYLAILHVKLMKNMPIERELEKVNAVLEVQISNMDEILRSSEYMMLYVANQDTFSAIDKASRDELTASEVQKINRQRFDAKQALQKRFWNKPLTELKTEGA